MESAGLIGGSKALRTVRERIARLAPLPKSVLLLGETGTGKELAARLIHQMSFRVGPLAAMNCATITGELAVSQLFGHVRGAFTSAVTDAHGLFESAKRGTIFLDEVTELSLPIQAMLLRVLDEGKCRRVGTMVEYATDARVLVASNKNLEEAVAQKTFREDLYYRLSALRLEMPPLRKRPEDIEPISAHFMRKYAKDVGSEKNISRGALNALKDHSWPGNVRELDNVVCHACIYSSHDEISPDDLELRSNTPTSEPPKLTLKEAERQYLEWFVRRHPGSLRGMARELEVSRQGLYRKLEEHGLSNAAGIRRRPRES